MFHFAGTPFIFIDFGQMNCLEIDAAILTGGENGYSASSKSFGSINMVLNSK